MNCKVCGIGIVVTPLRGPQKTYCSDRCKWLFRHPPKGKSDRTCAECGKLFKAFNARFCSPACAHKNLSRGRLYECKCKTCGIGFTARTKDKRYCSNSCVPWEKRQKTPGEMKARKRLNWIHRNHIRRMLYRETSVEYINPEEIFNRDGWRCQHCGCKTHRGGSQHHPKYANLDHIIPLSRGGHHVKLNLQCLCRACNMSKSAKTEGEQLLLVS